MVGKTISHFKILEKIGAGGMGVIFKAEVTNLKRSVTLAIQPTDGPQDQQIFIIKDVGAFGEGLR